LEKNFVALRKIPLLSTIEFFLYFSLHFSIAWLGVFMALMASHSGHKQAALFFVCWMAAIFSGYISLSFFFGSISLYLFFCSSHK